MNKSVKNGQQKKVLLMRKISEHINFCNDYRIQIKPTPLKSEIGLLPEI